MENSKNTNRTRQLPATNDDWTSPIEWSLTAYFDNCEERHMRPSTALKGRRIA